MDGNISTRPEAETFMAVVGAEVPEPEWAFDSDASTRCGSGMARMKDD